MKVTSKGLDSWFLILLVICASTPLVDSQLDPNGFINIDCGRAPNSSFYDSNIKSTYVSDDQFIDTGENHRIDSKYDTRGLYEQFQTVRSFPSGTRNCYNLRSLIIGSKYLVRAEFMYGNYDNMNYLPTFDLHLGVNYWNTVVFTTEDGAILAEIIATATSDFLQVCLINKKLGTPFISVLHLSQLKPNIYASVNSTQSFVYSNRENLGATDFLRYPDDRLDRLWRPYTQTTPWKNISTNSTMNTDTNFSTPSAVLQTAATTLSTTQPLTFDWISDNESIEFCVILHFSEIRNITSRDIREFDILSNGLPIFKSYVPPKLASGWATFVTSGYNEYNVSLQASLNSTLPPLLNAFEFYVITSATGVPTNNGDVTAINTIKASYNIEKGWSGDPCVPIEYAWNGVSCTSDYTNIPRITTLNLSSSGLTGAIISSFGNLTALTSLDLSNNDLSGDLPAFLDKLSALKFLDITGNDNLSTTLPPGLQSRKKDGNLIFKSVEQKNKKISSVVIIAVVIGVVVLLLIATAITLFGYLRRRKYNQSDVQRPTAGYGTNPQVYNQLQKFSNASTANIYEPNVAVEGRLDFKNRQYRYKDLERITNKFQNHIGTGGFGSVYLGVLDDDIQVAVKMRSHSSSQGVKEFLAEAQNLARVHHKNLVSLIGYCMDGDYMALVYEYMQEGTLQEKLRDNARPLSWKQRIRIAYESALGLEYLHKSCNPPLIHRDVKASNILLNENLVAKIADFGLSREFSTTSSHVSTLVVGTPGYVDPEYYSSFQLSVKSDVFSFGVVLLEIITGKPPIIPGTEGIHLKQWVNQKLSRGDIESIVDPKMQGQYDINSIWKVAELASRCTENISAKRPTMSMVVLELEESLDLEISTEGVDGKDTTNYDPNNYLRNENFGSDASQNIVMEIANFRGMEGPDPEVR